MFRVNYFPLRFLLPSFSFPLCFLLPSFAFPLRFLLPSLSGPSHFGSAHSQLLPSVYLHSFNGQALCPHPLAVLINGEIIHKSKCELAGIWFFCMQLVAHTARSNTRNDATVSDSQHFFSKSGGVVPDQIRHNDAKLLVLSILGFTEQTNDESQLPQILRRDIERHCKQAHACDGQRFPKALLSGVLARFADIHLNAYDLSRLGIGNFRSTAAVPPATIVPYQAKLNLKNCSRDELEHLVVVAKSETDHARHERDELRKSSDYWKEKQQKTANQVAALQK